MPDQPKLSKETRTLTLSAEDWRLLHRAASTTIQLYDQVEADSWVPRQAPLYGKRDRLVELARLIDHEANQGGARA